MKISLRLHRFIFALLFLGSSGVAVADYLWPLPFGNELTSIFGDYRTRRYHVGIDVRTGGEIGKTVIAPTDGYVSRLRTGYFGYGKVIYFRTTDGNICVFAHLSAFAPEMEEFIRQRQISSESYNQDVELNEDKFRYRRGETIAFSGATGVGAPHLHFEVRTPDNVPVNPLTLKGLEVPDRRAPVFKSLRLVGFGNDELARALGWNLSYSFRKSPRDTVYSLAVALPCGLEDYWLSAEIVDKVGESMSDKPIYDLEVRCLDRVLYRLRYDKVSFDDTYLIDAQRNFPMAGAGNQEYYNLVDVATARRMAGICEMVGQDPPPIEIIARDVVGNTSKAIVRIFDSTHNSKEGNFVTPKPDTVRLNSLIDKYGEDFGAQQAAWIPGGKALYLLVKLQSAKPAKVSAVNLSNDLNAPLQQVVGRYYLGVVNRIFDAAAGDYVSQSQVTHVLIEPAAGESSSFEVPAAYQCIKNPSGKMVPLTSGDGQFSIEFPEDNGVMFPLEENYYFRIDRTGLDRFASYTVSPKSPALTKQISYRYGLGDSIPQGIGLYSAGGKGLYYMGGTIDSALKVITARAFVLATITARQDTIPPSVRQLRPAAGAFVTSARPRVSFRFSDDLSGVSDDIEIRLDGKWCIPVYDPESGEVTATPHFDIGKGKHKLDIKVLDKIGNLRSLSTEFTRRSK